MTSWKLGDSWITFHRSDTGIGVGKMQSQQEIHERRRMRYCTGCGEDRQSDCGSSDCDLLEAITCGELE